MISVLLQARNLDLIPDPDATALAKRQAACEAVAIECALALHWKESPAATAEFVQTVTRRNPVEPWPFGPVGYRERNRVERLFGKVKQFRRAATRYEKLKQTFLGVFHLTLGFIRAKSRMALNVNTT